MTDLPKAKCPHVVVGEDEQRDSVLTARVQRSEIKSRRVADWRKSSDE